MRLASCEKSADFAGLDRRRLQIKISSFAVRYNLSVDEPTSSSSEAPHESVHELLHPSSAMKEL